MDRWNGRLALVTGATSGIGASMAVTLAKKGMKVIGCGRREERIKELNKEHGVNIIPYKCDVSQVKEVTKMFDWIKSSKDSFGALSLLVCNAGFSTNQTLMEGNPNSWIKMMDVNVIAASLATQLAIKQFLEFAVDDGQIVYINSVYSHKYPDDGHEFLNFYSASKIANNALLEMWRKEITNMQPSNNINISGICPGYVDTEFVNAMQKGKSDAEIQAFIEANKKILTYLQPNNITDALLYILSTPPNVQINDLIIRPTGKSI